MGAARIGIFLIVIIVLILLGQSVRNRTVLKYDPSTRQVVQVPKSELGNSVEVLRPASEIVVETPEEVEERLTNTLTDAGIDPDVVKDEIKKSVREACAFQADPELGCYGNYEDDPNNPGCCKLKPGAKPGFSEKLELAKTLATELATGIVLGEIIEQGLKKATKKVGEKATTKATQEVLEKGGAKATQEATEKATTKATQEATESAAKSGAAATKSGAAATKGGAAAAKGGTAAAKGGAAATKSAAKGGAVATKGAAKSGAAVTKGAAAVASKGAAKTGARVATTKGASTAAKVGSTLAKGAMAAGKGAKAGGKMAAGAARAGGKMAAKGGMAAGRMATRMAGGPVGAVMLLFDAVSITLDLLDVDGYNSYTSQGMIDKGKRMIDHGEYEALGNMDDVDFPRLFPLYEFCPDEYLLALELTFFQMFEQYAIPEMTLDPAISPLWIKYATGVAEAGENGTEEPELPIEIEDFTIATVYKYHKERDVFIYENLKEFLEPEKYEMLEIVEWASSPNREGITLTQDGAAIWNAASRDTWLQHNDFFKPPPLELEYVNPTAGVYTDRVYITDRTNPGSEDDPNTIEVPFSELRTQHPQGELVFPDYPAGAKMVIAADYGGLVAFCTKRRQLSGISTAIDPAQLGVTFDIDKGVCNFTKEYCRRYGMDFKNNDCSTNDAQKFFELVLGTTITRAYKEEYLKAVDDLMSGDPLKMAKAALLLNPYTGFMWMTRKLVVDALLKEIFETKAKRTRPANVRDCGNFGAGLRDDGTSCWQDTIPLRSSMAKKKPCSDWHHKHGRFLRDDGTSCWKDTIPIKSGVTKKKPCDDWAHKYGRGLRDDGTSCWRDTLVRKSSMAKKKPCSDWHHKHGKGLRDDGTSCWRDTEVKKSRPAKKYSCAGPKSDEHPEGEWKAQYGKLRDDGTSCWSDTYVRKSSMAKKLSCKDPRLGDGTNPPYGGNLRDDGTSCWLDVYPKKSSIAKKLSCKDPRLGDGTNPAYEGRLRDDGTSCWLDAFGRGVGVLPGCADDEEKDGALCYPKCDGPTGKRKSARHGDTYSGVGPVCWKKSCPSDRPLKRGLICYEDCRDRGAEWFNGSLLECAACNNGWKSDGFLGCVRDSPWAWKGAWPYRKTRNQVGFDSFGRGVGKPLRVCKGTKSEKDAGLCYQPCDGPNGVKKTAKLGDTYKGVGPMCHPKAGAGIKKTLMQRQYCGPSSTRPGENRQLIAGVCWDKCIDGDSDDGALCNPAGGFGIKKTLMDRQYCGPSSTRPGQNRKLIAGVCWDECRSGDKTIGALCEPSRGIGIKKTLFDRYYCGSGDTAGKGQPHKSNERNDQTNVAGVCWDQCSKFESENGLKYTTVGALCHPKGGPGIKVPVWDREICGPSSYQRPLCKAYEEKNWTVISQGLKDRGQTELSEKAASGVVSDADFKQMGEILECPKMRKLIAGVCWDECPNEEVYGTKFTTVGALCHPEGGPGIKVTVDKREYCGPMANQPKKCEDLESMDVERITKMLDERGATDLATRIRAKASNTTEAVKQWITRSPGVDAKGNPLKSLYQEAEEASECPMRRRRILGVCWDRCPNGYTKMGAICEPPGGPKLVVPQWDRDYCGPSSFQPSRCAVIYGKNVTATVAEIRARGNNELADRVEANGLDDPALVKEVEGVLECPKKRKLVAGVCWDQCPREVIPANVDEVIKLRDAFTQAEKNYEAQRDIVNKAYLRYEEEYLGGVETWEDSKAFYLREKELEDSMIKIMKEAEAKWIPARKEYTRNRRTGYNEVGVLCEPQGYTDAVTGIKVKKGPSIVADLFRRYECPDGWKNVAGVCWEPCPDGYRDDGALCNKNATKEEGMSTDKILGF